MKTYSINQVASYNNCYRQEVVRCMPTLRLWIGDNVRLREDQVVKVSLYIAHYNATQDRFKALEQAKEEYIDNTLPKFDEL